MTKNKNNPVLGRIKESLRNESLQGEPTAHEAAPDLTSILSEGGFPEVHQALESAKAEMVFERRSVYIDNESAEVLDLLRKKAKIKSSLLVSFLLREFFSKHKDSIRQLIDIKSNSLLD
ncbi:hypothetical protein [Pontibacter litorisediminis]|uniref:hypothetical protein n=1 Tax=Pontibacter litorisediminis TaxID=1846260 RepID=UPI0023EAAA1B|nr:hypothetical protein [Pontibacter litorisediminis]